MTSNQPAQEDIPDSIAPPGFDLEQLNKTDAPFPVVGIAASAGGLEAFTQLLKHLPTDTGMAFVLIQHLDPNHKSLLTEILARTTQMPVNEVQTGVAVEPNHVYVIPPNTKMALVGGVLQLMPREKIGGKYMPGDAFFVSLAVDRGPKAIAVVLSGSDGDGSLGLKAIKAAGGVTFAQCEATAQFDSMPNTAVATGDVDFILPPERIAEELANLSHNLFISCPLPLNPGEDAADDEPTLASIFTLLRSMTGVDFTHYKPNTIERRMQRRMLLYKLERLEDYAQYLRSHPAEVQALYEEILIHVTSFFRDPEAFDLLKEQVFPAIAQNKSAKSPIRIWDAGCSTGEEVYSIAICLLEFLENQAIQLPIQIFATDISETAIAKARAGIYQENQMLDVSAERRRKYFHPLEAGGYQINKAVRELCVFARQDLGSDPPFSSLDLISCRNVLIYLGEALQKRVMPLFHYSLNPNAFLLLGTAESVGNFADLFSLVDRKYKVYVKQQSATRPIFSFVTHKYPIVKLDEHPQLPAIAVNGFDLQKQTDQLLLNHYAPVGVVINDKMEVLQLRGDIDRYLKLVSGMVNLNLFNLVREGLLIELQAAVYQAQRQGLSVTKTGLYITEGDQSRLVNLQVIPFKALPTEAPHFVVLFEAAPPTVSTLSPSSADHPQSDLERENVRLQAELEEVYKERAATQEYLQAIGKEQEAINQDLKVANEEILSSNEELQSTNEELETAKEEIQATNEELNTTNEELRSRNLELHQVNNDLTNLLASINIPILMLTQDLRIRRFTPMAQRLFNFISTDAGRPLSDIRANLNIPDLEPLILEVLDTLSVKELEVQTEGGHWYMLRIRPYRTTENQIDGVVLVLLDIDDLKRNAATLEAARNYAEAIVETVQVPLLVLESDLRVNKANRSFYETFQVSPPNTMRSLLFELGNGQWNIPALRSCLEDVFANDTTIQDFEIEQVGQKTVLLNACKLQQDNMSMILLSIADITAQKQFETERSQLLTQEQAARQAAETANRAKDEFLSNLSHELRNPLNTILGWSQLLRSRIQTEATITRALEVIERSAKAQAQLIEDLLDVSRIISGKLRLNLRPIDLRLIVQAAIDSSQLSAAAKNIQIVTSLHSATVVGDSDRLQQILWNLLSNAIKFTPAGGRVEVKLESSQFSVLSSQLPDPINPIQTSKALSAANANKTQNSAAVITITDTGQGIQADLLPYIFDRFRQGDSSPTKAIAGLGLGLSIVRHLVELHGGTVQAESAGEGQGATLRVWLPLQSPLPLPAQPAAVPSILATTPLALNSNGSQDQTPALAGLQILAVDDEVDALELLKVSLEGCGAEVLTVTTASAAIAALSATPNRYNVLLSDIGMPEQDGYSLMRQVRTFDVSAGGQIPAIAITAYASDRERQMALDAGFQAHLVKPIELDQLALAIANLIQGS